MAHFAENCFPSGKVIVPMRSPEVRFEGKSSKGMRFTHLDCPWTITGFFNPSSLNVAVV